MKAFFVKLLVRYKHLEKRDRLALNSLGVFFGLLILYFAIWSPVDQFYEDSKAERDRELSLIQYMRNSEKQARASTKGAGAGSSGRSLLTLVSRAAQGKGIKPDRVQPEGSDAVSIWFNSVSFDDLINFIKQIQSIDGIYVQQISIDREDSPGTVKTRIVLRS
jgi:general secretion pathway protein M